MFSIVTGYQITISQCPHLYLQKPQSAPIRLRVAPPVMRTAYVWICMVPTIPAFAPATLMDQIVVVRLSMDTSCRGNYDSSLISCCPTVIYL